MLVSMIGVHNVLGVKQAEFTPGALTIIQGGNGTGKTSVLEALFSLARGGHDPSLLRVGEEVGEVVMVMEDGVEIRKRITEKASTLTVTHPTLGAISKPQSYVDRLLDALSVNPVSFLSAPPKKRGEMLLEAMPLKVSREQLAEALGEANIGDFAPADRHALEVLEIARKAVYDERTGTNRAGKEKRATVGQLAGSLPEDDRDTRALLEHVRELRTEKEQASRDYETELHRIDAQADRTVKEVQDEARRRIEALRQAAETEKGKVSARAIPRGEELSAALSQAETLLKEAERHANTRGILHGIEAEAGKLEAHGAALTAALERLDGLKESLLSDLPIKGVEIRGGEVYKGGIPFDRLNRAEQVKLAIRVAQLRAGELKLVCVDGLEVLDAQTFAAFAENAPRAGLQFVVTRVAPGPLSVATAEAEGVAS